MVSEGHRQPMDKGASTLRVREKDRERLRGKEREREGGRAREGGRERRRQEERERGKKRERGREGHRERETGRERDRDIERKGERGKAREEETTLRRGDRSLFSLSCRSPAVAKCIEPLDQRPRQRGLRYTMSGQESASHQGLG